MQIDKHAVATIDYTLIDDTGEVLDSSRGQDPLSYIHGVGSLIPGLEQALEGKEAGDSISVTIPPENAYGERNEDLVHVVERGQFGVDDLQTGMRFRVQSEVGEQVVVVTNIDGDDVTVDGNHPLAGETLKFEVDVKAVREASPEELDHGHAHGPGGHGH